jgi:ureidoacrylate peracid hydrolase
MHNSQIRADVVDRILKRRGRLHIHDELDPTRTAFVVIDMQRAFVDESLPSAVPVAREIVPNINWLAGQFRDRGAPVIWVYTTFSESARDDWSVFFGGVYSAQFSRAVVENLRAGSYGHGLYDGLDIHRDDWQITKDRFSAFLPGACDLGDRLRAREIDTVVIAGTVTNVCCESSARDAMMRNFHVLMATDANAALSDADHNASLTALAQTFADVMDVGQIAALLDISNQHRRQTPPVAASNG